MVRASPHYPFSTQCSMRAHLWRILVCSLGVHGCSSADARLRQRLVCAQQVRADTSRLPFALAGLYRGFSAAAIREMSYSSLRFGLYEPIKIALGADKNASAGERPTDAPVHDRANDDAHHAVHEQLCRWYACTREIASCALA